MSARGSSNRHVPVVVGLVVFMAAGLFGVTAAAPAVVRAAPGDVGLPGPSFAGSGADPTGTKPESKVWFNDGFWWASMYNGAASAFTIHRLSGATWTNTGAVIDARENTHSDALWDQAAGKLYIASHVYTTSPSNGNNALLYRYSYNAGADTYALDGGFPQTINTWSSETLVIDKDSTGQLWATWTRGGSVRVNRTDEWRPDLGHRVRPRRHQPDDRHATTSRRSSRSAATRSASCGATRTGAPTSSASASTTTAPPTRPGAPASRSTRATTSRTTTST